MIAINELREAIQTFGSQAIDEGDLNEILDRLEAAENENAKLRIALAEKVTSETTLRDLSVGNGSINATFEGGAIQLMVDALATQFVESGASNYIEMQFHSEATGPLLFALQRVDGKTPHQLRAEAEQERDWHAERCEDAMNECDSLLAAVRHEADCVEACKSEIERLRADKVTLQQMTYYLKDCLEAAEKAVESLRQGISFRDDVVAALAVERDALRAKIEATEKQEPVAEMVDDDFGKQIKGINYWWRLPNGAKLYALPGAQPAPSVPEGWKLVPTEPTRNMLDCMDLGSNMLYRYRAMLAAAPEAKP